MSIQDIIDFLDDESQQQTLHRKTIERCVLLAYDLGLRDAYLPPTAPLAVPDVTAQEEGRR